MDKTIINSLLDTDFYKFTMGQLVFRLHPDVQVEYALTNRTSKVRLAEIVDIGELREHLDHARTLRFTKTELHYLRGTNEYGDRMFNEPYLDFLSRYQLPPYDLSIKDGQFDLRFGGLWAESIYWETIALPIVDELYTRAMTNSMTRFEKKCLEAQGLLRLRDKIAKLRQFPDITFTDFGTRRRFSFDWHKKVVKILAEEMPLQFLGTSNTFLAMILALLPMGTNAHELAMVYAGMTNDDEDLRHSNKKVLDDWWKVYDWGLSIALTDTFGTRSFFENMSRSQAKNWKGLRQDSGDPSTFGEMAIKFYESCDVDPGEKLIVFSDGLDVDKIMGLADQFRRRIRFTFGWGTNLTNDLGTPTLSLVIKAVQADGQGLVKLSDNLAKAIGNPADVERYKRVFGYTSDFREECRY